MDWPYRLCQLGGRFVFCCTMRVRLIRPEAMNRRGPYVIACTHLSHLEPFLLAVLAPGPIDWVTRTEFFKYRPVAWLLRILNAIEVRRFGVPVSAIRASIRSLETGRIVGICPEGGVVKGADSCIRGGKIKQGACLISYRTGAPILPCVILGADKLNCVPPWLPFRRAKLWVAFAQRPIEPRRDLDRREARKIMAEELGREYVRLFRELLQNFEIQEEEVP